MKKQLYRILLILGLFLSTQRIAAQQVSTLYFMDNVPVRHYLNPAFQPLNGSYLAFPLLGYVKSGFSTKPITLSDFAFNLNNVTINAFDSQGNKEKFYNAFQPLTLINADAQLSLLAYGFRADRAYWNFSLSAKGNSQMSLPKDLIKLLVYGTPLHQPNHFDFSSFGGSGSSYLEFAVGYSKTLNSKWTFGGKFKYLFGLAHMSITHEDFELSTDNLIWKFHGRGILKSSIASGTRVGNRLDSLHVSPISSINWLKPAGNGIGFDFGVTYSPIKNLVFSAAVLDLGFIKWKNTVKNLDYQIDYSFDGTKLNGISDLDESAAIDSIKSAFNFSTVSNVNNDSYTTSTLAKMNIGVEYSFLKNTMSVGLLSASAFFKEKVYQELTTSFNLRPANWFNLSLSYSVLNGKSSNLGAGVGLRTGFMHWFISADYVPLSFEKYNSFSAPYNTHNINVALGVNLVFHNSKDSDKDGVIDNRDECPGTPFGVSVDKKGCPIDTDGDGVPNYLDKCPRTPHEADQKVDSKGCLLDSDGDKVPDYLDKCPNTPKESASMVDSVGCSLDSDKDGVYDYLDKCPKTPRGIKIDSFGCPLDEDGDGVPDYLDKCPNTPVEARGKVDAKGCPIDSDNDGVFDYLDICDVKPTKTANVVDVNGCILDADKDGVSDNLDECPNTPIAAKGMVDEKGCLLDTDKDDVPDYLDKHPNTPPGLKVNAEGCPADIDRDGVYDYMDECPRVPGLKTNKGCPEIKKEAKRVFQKALKAIQFMPNKAKIMRSSFPILNQIANILINNPSYIVEIAGHTDNVGSAPKNLIFSDQRAAAVKEYLIYKGVDSKRMTSIGYGETKPIGDNNTAKGKAKNRRVEFIITFEEVVFE